MTTWSSTRSPSGTVSRRNVNPLLAPRVVVLTVSAATSRSTEFVVVKVPLLLVELLPDICDTASRGILGSIPLYSMIRISGKAAAEPKVTVTALAPAFAELIFAA